MKHFNTVTIEILKSTMIRFIFVLFLVSPFTIISQTESEFNVI